MQWSRQVVDQVKERPQAYLLGQNGSGMLDVPYEPLTAEEDATLPAFLAERGLLPNRA